MVKPEKSVRMEPEKRPCSGGVVVPGVAGSTGEEVARRRGAGAELAQGCAWWGEACVGAEVATVGVSVGSGCGSGKTIYLLYGNGLNGLLKWATMHNNAGPIITSVASDICIAYNSIDVDTCKGIPARSTVSNAPALRWIGTLADAPQWVSLELLRYLLLSYIFIP